MDIKSKSQERRLKEIVRDALTAMHDLDGIPHELEYAIDESFDDGCADDLDKQISRVEFIFQCEWDASIDEFKPIWESRKND